MRPPITTLAIHTWKEHGKPTPWRRDGSKTRELDSDEENVRSRASLSRPRCWPGSESTIHVGECVERKTQRSTSCYELPDRWKQASDGTLDHDSDRSIARGKAHVPELEAFWGARTLPGLTEALNEFDLDNISSSSQSEDRFSDGAEGLVPCASHGSRTAVRNSFRTSISLDDMRSWRKPGRVVMAVGNFSHVGSPILSSSSGRPVVVPTQPLPSPLGSMGTLEEGPRNVLCFHNRDELPRSVSVDMNLRSDRPRPTF
uniref:Uncharacterized protein n=1 Tax=Compsopogon caeruleus TaxID=31354 RepID=A0A6T6AYK8_9RHOD|mmetsp:Transcript_12730/g.25827  ORF Transcript_12730/g.25827 Transcript_12730/m.25827 type:complete len:258 (+) Transcript_12730:170-943(+)